MLSEMIFIASPKSKLQTVSKKIIHHVNLSNKKMNIIWYNIIYI